MYLGLDISTSITGVTLLDDAGKVLLCEHINLKKESDLFKKAKIVEEHLVQIQPHSYTSLEVFIEESLQKFSTGLSSAKTLSMLTKFNGIISWIIWDKLGYSPQYIPAISARKECGIKVEKGKRAKEVVMQYMLDKEPWFKVEYGRTGKIRPHHYDEADSFIIATAGFLRCMKNKK